VVKAHRGGVAGWNVGTTHRTHRGWGWKCLARQRRVATAHTQNQQPMNMSNRRQAGGGGGSGSRWALEKAHTQQRQGHLFTVGTSTHLRGMGCLLLHPQDRCIIYHTHTHQQAPHHPPQPRPPRTGLSHHQRPRWQGRQAGTVVAGSVRPSGRRRGWWCGRMAGTYVAEGQWQVAGEKVPTVWEGR